jgi:hypothetical protein
LRHQLSEVSRKSFTSTRSAISHHVSAHLSSFLDSAVDSERATLMRGGLRVAPVSFQSCYKMVAKIPLVIPVS